jgi:hypothetical protein
MSDHPDDFAAGFLRNGLGEFPLLIFKILKSDFDQLVVLQRLVDGRQHTGCEPGFPHVHDRFETVRESAQVFAIRTFEGPGV